MVASNFPKSYDFMQIDEKGKDDDPNDRGGRTCDGVTQDEFDAFCKAHNQPESDVWTISEGTKQAIYYLNYWMPWCDRLPDGIDYLWFDACVNSGPREATLFLQRAMKFNKRQIDGHMGVYTCQRAIEWPDKMQLVVDFCIEHISFYHELVREHPSDQEFIHGWLNRVDHERANAHSLLASARPQTQSGIVTS